MFDFAPTDWQAMVLSARVAVTATVVSLPFGIAVAYLMVFTRMRAKALFDGIVNLPLVLPPVVVGYLLLLLLGRRSWLGQWLENAGIEIVFTWKAAVIASMVVGFPLLVRSVRIGMEEIDPHLIQASRTLGARWYDTLITVVLPLSLRAILAGSTLMFARSLGEFGATIIIAGNIPGVTQTIPLAIYDYTSMPGGERMALGLCVVSIVLALAVLMVNEGLVQRFGRERRR
ncbi:MAG TPA: molybdate ABC transporter permease subunit [Candidatus Krumholzibacteria bacterium]|nr:molybdate ABC transporter permease subunit [Candidatus Krumholzibacteria bacterium]